MNDVLHLATGDLASYLSNQLPQLSPDWWNRHVVGRLSFQQQRTVQERHLKSLNHLDFAALLRVLDQNWFELSNAFPLPREGRTWVKELQTVRNKWAHLSAEAMPPSEVYRDADTLGRLLEMIEAKPRTLAAVGDLKAKAVGAMAAPSNTPIVEENAVQKGTTNPITSLFKAGEVVALRADPTILMPINEVILGGAETRYRVFHNNAYATYYERQLQAVTAANNENQHIEVSELHARLTSLQLLSPSNANLYSLRAGRIQHVPYQYRPVLKFIRAEQPRLLIADEVGVGKTIETGLILKELQARTDISSVLIICPKALVAERKWQLEMQRFGEQFTHLDGATLRHCLHETDLEGEWPERHAKTILPFSLFDSDLVLGSDKTARRRKEKGLLELDPPPKFDLVIVDEAHNIRNSSTFLHQGVRYFCDNAQAVLLLTATPVQLGSEDLFTLLNVLRPDLVIDQASFAQMAAPNPYINGAVQHCRQAQEGWQQGALECLDAVAQTEWGRLFLREDPGFQSAYDALQETSIDDATRVELIRTLERMYTFSPLLNRTRRRDIGKFTTRKSETVSVDFTPAQQRLHDDLLDVVARILTRCHNMTNVKFMMTTVRRQAASCIYGLAPLLANMLNKKLDLLDAAEFSADDQDFDLGFVDDVRTDVERLLERARDLDPHDPKVSAFTRVLNEKSELPNNKALVFSTFRHTLAYLHTHAQTTGLRVALIHGDVPDDERADLRRRFALPKEESEAVDVLLSSEVGCEGLDFQFCDMVLNYDLPWNPMKIEQRIGRVDRFGQESETVAIINFVTPGTVDADIYERCLLRIGVFQDAIGGSEEILGEITQELRDIAENFELTPEERAARLQQLADNEIRDVHEEQELEAREAELFGLNLPEKTWRREVEAAESYWLTPDSTERTVKVYLAERLGKDVESVVGDKALKSLRLNQAARNALLEDYKKLPRSTEPAVRAWEKWLKGDQPTLSVTFEQQTAADNPKVVLLSILHPLVRQAAHFLDVTETKHCSVQVSSDTLPAGEHRFALYRWSKRGIKQDETLVAVTEAPELEEVLVELLERVEDRPVTAPIDQAALDALDALHHSKWSEAQASHIADNQLLVEHRVQSLTASHRARVRTIEDQLFRATNEKIRRMKQGELSRANADFDRRMTELQQSATTGDISTSQILVGTLLVSQAVSA